MIHNRIGVVNGSHASLRNAIYWAHAHFLGHSWHQVILHSRDLIGKIGEMERSNQLGHI